MDMEKVIFILVFLAAGLLAYSLVSVSYDMMEDKADRKRVIQETNNAAMTPMEYFISIRNLLRLRVNVCALVVCVIMAILLLSGVHSPGPLLVLCSIFGIVGFMAPLWYYSFRVERRKKTIEDQLLSVIIGMQSGIQSGQAAPQSLLSVTKRSAPPIKDELQIVAREFNLGRPLHEALENMHKRVPCEDLQLLITSIKLSRETGGKLSDVLKQLIINIRQRREFQRKLDALTAQGKFEAIVMAMAPTIAFVLMYCIDKDLMQPMLVSRIGWIAIGVVTVLEIIGFIAIKKIITIDV